jgi:hypothetical protein
MSTENNPGASQERTSRGAHFAKKHGQHQRRDKGWLLRAARKCGSGTSSAKLLNSRTLEKTRHKILFSWEPAPHSDLPPLQCWCTDRPACARGASSDSAHSGPLRSVAHSSSSPLPSSVHGTKTSLWSRGLPLWQLEDTAWLSSDSPRHPHLQALLPDLEVHRSDWKHSEAVPAQSAQD